MTRQATIPEGTSERARTVGAVFRQLALESALVTVAILAYFGIRNATVGNPREAFANAERLFDLEQWLGIAWEEAVQGTIIGSDALVTLANWVYIWGHWPVILSVAVVLYLCRRDRYHLLRNALFISGGIGFLFFALLPVAPPRLLDLGLVDTVTEQSSAYRTLQPPGLTNQYAALPSLHFGWNLLVGIVLFTTTAHLLVRAFAVASPAAMGFAVVATANHFVIDVAVGAVVVLVALGAASAIQSRRAAATLEPSGSIARMESPERAQPVSRGASGRQPPPGSEGGGAERRQVRRG